MRISSDVVEWDGENSAIHEIDVLGGMPNKKRLLASRVYACQDRFSFLLDPEDLTTNNSLQVHRETEHFKEDNA